MASGTRGVTNVMKRSPSYAFVKSAVWLPCGKWDTGSNECHETPAAKKISCGDVVSGTRALGCICRA